MYSDIGIFLRKVRIDRGERLLDMAKKLNVSSSFLSSIEYGRRNPPEGFHDLVSEAYSLDREQSSIFSKIYAHARDKISLSPNQDLGREVAVALARRMNSLPQSKLQQIQKLLEDDDDPRPFPLMENSCRLGLPSSGVGALNYVVRPRSWKEIDEIAQSFRARYGVIEAFINPIKILEEDMLEKQGVHLDVYPEDSMGLTEGFTDFHGNYIVLREDVYHSAWNGNTRARFTVAHEIGHIELHKSQINGMTRMPTSADKDYVLSEPQANEYAACLLMPFDHFQPSDINNSVAEKFGVSKTPARIRLEKYRKQLGIGGSEQLF